MKPHGRVLMLYDGPEEWGEGELSRQHPYQRLTGGVAVAFTRYEGETRRRVKAQGAAWDVRIHGGQRGADFSDFIGLRRRFTLAWRDFAVCVQGDDFLFAVRPEVLHSHFAAVRGLLQTVVSGQRGAPLTFTKLCPPVLEPHLERGQGCLAAEHDLLAGALEPFPLWITSQRTHLKYKQKSLIWNFNEFLQSNLMEESHKGLESHNSDNKN